MALEPQTCPTRLSQVGPWDRALNEDTWRDDNWPRTKDAGEIALQEYLAQNPGSVASNNWFRWSWMPRVCSFCGSVHPDDFFRLIREKWEIEWAKGYKIYVHPPGYTIYIRRWGAAGHRNRYFNAAGDPIDPLEEVFWQPTPPVKLYLDHFSKEHHAELKLLGLR